MSSWGESPQDFVGEPRKVFVNFLIWNCKQIESVMYFGRRPARAILPLMGLIDTLSEKDKKTLKKAYQKLQAMRAGTLTTKTGDVEAIFSEVLNYLHKTYLKEIGLAFPTRPSKTRMRVPRE